MSTPSPAPVWGAPQTEPAHWSLHKTLAAVGIAVVLAGAGAAVIYAAGGSTERSGFGPMPPGRGPGGMGPGAFGMPPGASIALHGQFVMPDGHGGYTTELTQTGVVTDISDASITARSADGFTQTYLITADTRQGRDELGRGDTASIRAVAGNGSNTATVISTAG